MKTRLNDQALQNLQELDKGLDSFQEYGEFNKAKQKSESLKKIRRIGVVGLMHVNARQRNA